MLPLALLSDQQVLSRVPFKAKWLEGGRWPELLEQIVLIASGADTGRRRRDPSADEHSQIKGVNRCRLTAYEFSGNTRANARVLSAATRG
jgi:hypothetical protein